MFLGVVETPLQFIFVASLSNNYYFTICGYWLLQNLEKRKKSNNFNRLQMELFFLQNISLPRIQTHQICCLSVYMPGHINGILWYLSENGDLWFCLKCNSHLFPFGSLNNIAFMLHILNSSNIKKQK